MFIGALTWFVDTAHLDGAGHMTRCSTFRVYEGPLLSSNQVTWDALRGQMKKQNTIDVSKYMK